MIGRRDHQSRQLAFNEVSMPCRLIGVWGKENQRHRLRFRRLRLLLRQERGQVPTAGFIEG
jgi:hypothetical protein